MTAGQEQIGDAVTSVPNSCDTHLHFYDSRYVPARTALLHPPDATPEDYNELQRQLGHDRLVIVQPRTSWVA